MFVKNIFAIFPAPFLSETDYKDRSFIFNFQIFRAEKLNYLRTYAFENRLFPIADANIGTFSDSPNFLKTFLRKYRKKTRFCGNPPMHTLYIC